MCKEPFAANKIARTQTGIYGIYAILQFCSGFKIAFSSWIILISTFKLFITGNYTDVQPYLK